MSKTIFWTDIRTDRDISSHASHLLRRLTIKYKCIDATLGINPSCSSVCKTILYVHVPIRANFMPVSAVGTCGAMTPGVSNMYNLGSSLTYGATDAVWDELDLKCLALLQTKQATCITDKKDVVLKEGTMAMTVCHTQISSKRYS